MKSVSANFYAGLPVLTDFTAVTRPANFAPLPADAFKERAAKLLQSRSDP